LLKRIDPILHRARQDNQRRVLVFSGSAAWGEASLKALLESRFRGGNILLLGNKKKAGIAALSFTQTAKYLGSECDCLVVDAWSGIHPDGLSALSGTVLGGGLVVILAPPQQEWLTVRTGFDRRHCIYPHTEKDLRQHFLKRFVKGLQQSEAVTFLYEEDENKEENRTDDEQEWKPQESTTGLYLGEQEEAVSHIKHVVTGHRRRPLVLTAHRGRGKSAALGIAAAQLLEEHEHIKKIVVTSPSVVAVQSLFQRAEKLLGEKCKNNRLESKLGCIEFIAPDELLQNLPDLDLLLVDEAAAIPVPMLTAMVQKYSRCAFASTVHGYEGSGRGFMIRFSKELNNQAKQWKHFNMESPVRWAQDDPLEKLLFDLFMFDAELFPDADFNNGDQSEVAVVVEKDQCQVEELQQDALLEDEAMLREMFALLLSAHYRTTPMDLYYLLDALNVRVFILRHQGKLAGVCALAVEGKFSEDMANAIWQSERRPMGHLLPQQLALQCGCKEGLSMSGGRIVRIAVSPALQSKGMGSYLLEQVIESVKADLDYVGSSFGATEPLLRFWLRQEFQAVQLGIRREASSGAHAAVVIKPLSDTAHLVLPELHYQCGQGLLWRIPEYFATIEANMVQLLFSYSRLPVEGLIQEEHEVLRLFAEGKRSIGMIEPLLARFLLYLLCTESGKRLRGEEHEVLIKRCIQQQSWEMLSKTYSLPGRAAVVDKMRQALSTLF